MFPSKCSSEMIRTEGPTRQCVGFLLTCWRMLECLAAVRAPPQIIESLGGGHVHSFLMEKSVINIGQAVWCHTQVSESEEKWTLAMCQGFLMTKLKLRWTRIALKLSPPTPGPSLRPSDPGRSTAYTEPFTVPQPARSASALVRPRPILSNPQWLPSQTTRSKPFETPSINWNPGCSNWKPSWGIVMDLPPAAQKNLSNPSGWSWWAPLELVGPHKPWRLFRARAYVSYRKGDTGTKDPGQILCLPSGRQSPQCYARDPAANAYDPS